MKWFRKRSVKRQKNHNIKPTRGKLIAPQRQVKEAGWMELDYQVAASYFTKTY